MNEHPNLRDLIEFVSMHTLRAEDLEQSKVVNAHLSDCAACRARVRDLQTVYDALCRELGTSAAAAELAKTAADVEKHPRTAKSKRQ